MSGFSRTSGLGRSAGLPGNDPRDSVGFQDLLVKSTSNVSKRARSSPRRQQMIGRSGPTPVSALGFGKGFKQHDAAGCQASPSDGKRSRCR